MLPRSVLLLIFVFAATALQAQPNRLWTFSHDVPLPAQDANQLVRVDAQGNSFVLNLEGDDTRVIKYSPDGAVLWRAKFGASDNQATQVGLELDKDGSPIAASRDFTAKFDSASGNKLWEKLHAATSYGGLSVDPAGHVVRGFGLGTRTTLVIKYSGTDGGELWRRMLTSAQDDAPVGVDTDAQSNVYALRTTRYAKYTPLGSGSWAISVPTPLMGPLFQVAPNGSLYVATRVSIPTDNDAIRVQKLRPSNGTVEWAKDHNFSLGDLPLCLDLYSNGDVIVGVTDVWVSPWVSRVARISGTSGEELWAQTFSVETQSFPTAVDTDSSGRAYVVYNTRDSDQSITSNRFIQFARYSSSGEAVIGKPIRVGGRQLGGATDLAFSYGFAYVVGSTAGASKAAGPTDGVTYKFNATTTIPVWSDFEAGFGGANDGLADSRVSGDNLLLTGVSRSRTDLMTAIIATSISTGELVWSATLPGGSDSTGTEGEYYVESEVDAAGNVLVANFRGSSMYAYKLRGSDGSRLWTTSRSFPSPITFVKGALDAQGNFFVLARTPDAATLVKLRAADGALVLLRQYPQNTQGDVVSDGTYVYVGCSVLTKVRASDGLTVWQKPVPVGEELLIGPTGDVFGGSSLAFRARSSDGTVLWTRSITARDIALDPLGNVVVGDVLSDNFFVQKLSTGTGTTIWSRTADFVGFAVDHVDVAVDGSGHAYVAGSVSQSEHDSTAGLQMIKFRGTDGVLLWRVSGGTRENDKNADVVIGSGGKIFLSGTGGTDFFAAAYQQ